MYGIYDLTNDVWFHNNEFKLTWPTKEGAECYESEFHRINSELGYKTEVCILIRK